MTWIALAAASIVVPPPVADDGLTRIEVYTADGEPMPGQTVTVLHRPGTPFEVEVAVGITDGRGQTPWEPAHDGPYVIRAAGQRLEGVQPFSRPPLDALLALMGLLTAAILALGYGLRSLPRRAR